MERRQDDDSVVPPAGSGGIKKPQNPLSAPGPRTENFSSEQIQLNITTALLIVDVQQGLCHGDGAAFEAPRVIDRINFVSRRAPSGRADRGRSARVTRRPSRLRLRCLATCGRTDHVANGSALAEDHARFVSSYRARCPAPCPRRHALDDLRTAKRLLHRHHNSSRLSAWISRNACRGRPLHRRQCHPDRRSNHGTP